MRNHPTPTRRDNKHFQHLIDSDAALLLFDGQGLQVKPTRPLPAIISKNFQILPGFGCIGISE